MGIGMHLGILDGIGEIIGNVFNWLFKTILTPILRMVINAIMKVVQYTLATIFYQLSALLLQLVDFVEVLFRTLAGLENEEMRLTLSGSNTDSPDLLVQMLRSEVVVQAFLSCCIVGLFLLIITTIFQMLKVEYTTEGAQNSKSSIFGKSLKSLANLLLIPVLVIFGVVIGNSVLELIDTATGGGDGASIGGLLWTTAASDAMWKDGKCPDWLMALGGPLLLEPGTMSTFGAITGIAAAFDFNTDNDEYGSGIFSGTLMGDRTPDVRERIENAFQTGDSFESSIKVGDNTVSFGVTLSYANPIQAFQYYNLFEVNYLLLIFGSCIMIKCLFHVCFGMVDRIYQCVALFIVSPFVIGMSPVKDSLGAWRSKFIQKALSAYGTIISLNLFFIIVQLFLNIEIEFKNTASAGIMMSSSFMEGLVKAIFVIVGGLMIEKLAGDLGQYFGGGNAMAEGKGLAGEVGKMAASAVKTGVGVASMAAGGAGLAIKGISMASKIGKGAAAASKAAKGTGFMNRTKAMFRGGKDAYYDNKTPGAQSKLADAQDKAANARANTSNAVQNYDSAMDGINEDEMNAYAATKAENDAARSAIIDKRDAAKAEMDIQAAIMNDKSGKYTEKEKKAAADAHATASKAYSDAGNELNNFKGKTLKLKHGNAASYDKAISARDALAEARANEASANEGVTVAENAVQEATSADNDAAEARSKLRRDKLQTNYNAFMQYGRDLAGSLPGGKLFNEIKGDWDKAKKTGNSYSDEGKQALQNVEDAAAKKKAERYDKDLINSMFIAANRRDATQKISQAIIERAEFKASDLNDQMNKMVKQWEGLANKTQRTDSENRTMEYLENQMRNLNPKVDFQGNQVINANITLDLGEFKNNIQEAIKRNATADEVNKIINDQLKKWGKEGNEQIIKEVRKAVEEIKNEVK